MRRGKRAPHGGKSMRRRRGFRAILALFAAAVLTAAFPNGQPAAHRAEAAMLDMQDYNGDKVTVSKVPEGRAGQKITIRFTIHNTFEEDLKNVRITLVDEQEYQDIYDGIFREDDEEDEDDDEDSVRHVPDNYPFEADSDTYKAKSIGDIRAKGTKNVSVTYRLRRDLPQGYYPAFFYLESDGGRWQGGRGFGVNLWVKAAKAENESDEDEKNSRVDYDFTLGDGQMTPYAAYGQVMNYSVVLTNVGQKKICAARLDMQLDADSTKFPFDINEGNYRRNIGDLEPGQSTEISYSMAVREDVKSGFFPIHYLLSYRKSEEDDYEEPVDLVCYVRVRGKDDEKEDGLDANAGEQERTKARIIVDAFSTEPADVYAGKPFTLHLRMKNASDKIPAANLMLTLESEEADNAPVFTADGGSNSAVINNLAPGASGEIAMRFVPDPTVPQKSYKFTVKEQYDSPEFKNATAEVTIAVPVRQESRFTLGTIDVMPDTIETGSETNVMFPVNNTGKVILYNVTARFEADSIDPAEAYVGNIKPGESGNVDTMLTGIAPTMDDGKIRMVISYEDEYGQVTETEKSMNLTVLEAQMPETDVDIPEEVPEETFGQKYGRKIALALAAAAAAAVLFLRRRKKKRAERAKKEEMEDDIT